jgi:hypothetical protein
MFLQILLHYKQWVRCGSLNYVNEGFGQNWINESFCDVNEFVVAFIVVEAHYFSNFKCNNNKRNRISKMCYMCW